MSTQQPQESATAEVWRNPQISQIYRSAEKVTGPFATALVEQSGVTSSKLDKITILDQATGTGAVPGALHKAFAASDAGENANWHLTCSDVSESMLAYTKERIKNSGWEKNTDTVFSDILKNGLENEAYDFVFSGFAFMALPNSASALDESLRVLKPGGTIALTTWQSLPWIDDVNGTAPTLSPNLPEVTKEKFFQIMGDGKWHDPSWIEALLRDKKLQDIQVNVSKKTIDIGTPQEVGPVSMAPMQLVMAHVWSDEQREKYKERFAPALLNYLEGKYGKNGPIVNDWEAILITAKKPL